MQPPCALAIIEGIFVERGGKMEQLNGIYEELVCLVGMEMTLRIYGHFKGQQVTFPIRLLSRSYVADRIAKEYNGRNLPELSRKYGYSERWIRELLRDTSRQKTEGE